MVLNFVIDITSDEPTILVQMISWSIEAFDTRSEYGSKKSNGAWLLIFQARGCRKKGQFSVRAKRQKLQLAQ